MSYQFTKTDKKQISSLLFFLSGVMKYSPVKRIEFTRTKKEDKILIERFNDENCDSFTIITKTIKLK